MTIAFFLQDLDGGGAQRAIIRLADQIAELGHKVDLVVGEANSDYRQEVSSKIRLIDFSTRSPFAIFFKLISYLRRHNPAVIMSALDPPNIMLVTAARLTRFKGRIVISQRGVLNGSLRDLSFIRRMLTWFLMSICFPRADAVISNSNAAAIELAERLKVPNDKIFMIHNAIDILRIKKFSNVPLDVSSISNSDIPLIISIGSLTKVKDYTTLIKAFAFVTMKRAARLVIIGKGPERPVLETLIEAVGLKNSIYLVGFDANPYKWIAAASVFVSSSTEEGFPNVIAESLALGCPVVATDCPGDTAELLEHGRWGRLVPVGDAERMAEAILATLDDVDPPDTSDRAADFSPSRNASAYLDVLLLKKSGTAESKRVL